jgi:hypothetical protein
MFFTLDASGIDSFVVSCQPHSRFKNLCAIEAEAKNFAPYRGGRLRRREPVVQPAAKD